MSAERLTPDGVPLPDGRRRFEFRLTHPIPPYLIAIAIGDLAVRPISARTAVVAEPSVVDRAAAEFVDLEKMVAAAEALYGPYRWGRYDVLVMPPSFPFGGMENPHADVRDADDPRRRSIADVADRARARPFVVGQPRDQRDVERFLAERGVHRLLRAAHHGGALWSASAWRCSRSSGARNWPRKSPASAPVPRTRTCACRWPAATRTTA